MATTSCVLPLIILISKSEIFERVESRRNLFFILVCSKLRITVTQLQMFYKKDASKIWRAYIAFESIYKA